ncbi:MAG: elongation factor Ts [Chlorobi bacterium]|nr:elongation factor Ts [Chlorobiota bacterium]
MAFTTADVVKLRKITGAGMMDCKNALTESDGDFDNALQIIREKGKLIANKRADRDASEGVALAKVSADKTTGAIIVLNCETDFVAKNESFIAFAEKILNLALDNNSATLEEVNALMLDGRTVAEQVTEQTGIIGEKTQLSYYSKINAESVAAYIHPGNKLATIVGFNKADVDPQVAKDIAMQITAMNPVSVDKESIPQETIDKELEIAKEKFRQEGKPEAMLDRIAQGALNKWFKEVALLHQTYVKDGKISIKEFLNQADKDLAVTKFDRYSLNA